MTSACITFLFNMLWLFESPHRKTRASKSTMLLIHLVLAKLLLDLTFLINNYVARLKSFVGCKIMAALMHCLACLLTTFTWFAVLVFSLCYQLRIGSRVVIRHYILCLHYQLEWVQIIISCSFDLITDLTFAIPLFSSSNFSPTEYSCGWPAHWKIWRRNQH